VQQIGLQIATLIVVLAIAAISLAAVRKWLLPHSLAWSTFASVIVAVFLGATGYPLAGGPASHVGAVVLLSAFIGMTAIQPNPWSVANLCRSLALVSGMVAFWTATRGNFVALSLAMGVTGVLLYISLLASAQESGR